MNASATQEKPSSAVLEDRGTLIDGLNEDLAGELQAIAMYIQYSALVQGSHREVLRELFQAELPDEMRHAQLLADKIAVWGGIPTTTSRPVPKASTPLQMLQNIFEAESQAVTDYTDRASQAEESGEVGLKVQLENVILDETRHMEEVEQIIAGWDRNAAKG